MTVSHRPQLELRVQGQAILAAKKAVRQNPAHSASYRCLACAFADLGRDAQAREAAAGVNEHDPPFTISTYNARGGQTKAKRLIEGPRKAGLPE
jgi:adenylate cyclase